MTANGRCRLAVVAVHPVQYHAPLYRAMARSADLLVAVLYLREHGFDNMVGSDGKSKPVIWNQDLLVGYEYELVPNIDHYAAKGGFFSRINPSLFRLLSRRQFDVVLIQGYAHLSMWIALLAARLSGVKIVWRGEVVERTSEAQPFWRARLRDVIAGFFVNRCDAVLYTCSGNRRFLERMGVSADRLFALPCAVDNDFMRQSARQFGSQVQAIKSDLDLNTEDCIVILCGRLTQRKRPFDLLEAVRRLNAFSMAVLFVGDGPLRAQISEFAAAHGLNVRFTGFVDQIEIGRYYSIADIFVIISDYDPSPKALNEAMNFGLPVIATNVIGTAEDLVRDSENGFLVKVGDVADIADKLGRLAKDRDLRRRFGDRSSEIVDGFNFEVNVAGIRAACSHVLSSGKGE